MKKIFFALIATLVILGAVYAFFFLYSLAPEEESLKEVLETMEQNTAVQREKDPKEEATIQKQTKKIPEALLEELEVSDLERRTESIATSPDIWQAFINAPVNHSGPSFIFGCLQYLETGGRLILDVFNDQVGNTWVAEASETELIGIGLVDKALFKTIQEYYEVNPEVACLELSRREYLTYKLITTQVEVKKQFDEFSLMVGKNFIVLPKEFRNSFSEAKDAILVGQSVVYLGLDGIIVFDFHTWEASLVYEFLWKDLHGISNLVQHKDDTSKVAVAVESWDQELGFVIVYEYEDNEGLSEVGKGSYAMAWQVGVNGIANLEFPEDLLFLNPTQLQVREYPEFNQKIVDGDYPPDKGKQVIDIWEL